MARRTVADSPAVATRPDLAAEWLEADGRGGFASGTVGGIRTRRYHAVLLAARTPPTGRVALVSGFDAWIERSEGGPTEFLSVQRYAPDVTTRSLDHLTGFSHRPWPTWTYRLADGLEVVQELFVPRGRSTVVLRWRLARPAPGIRLLVRPFLTGRDIHALHHENPVFRFHAEPGLPLIWRPYPGLPAIRSEHNGGYRAEPAWYRAFQLDEERARGFDFVEDAASPGVLSWDLSAGQAVWMLDAVEPHEPVELSGDPVGRAERLWRAERARRSRLGTDLVRAADAYVVARGEGRTIIAGYPWFTDWGRDTFISLRGLALATGRLDDARAILTQWATTVSEGMLPNRFVDAGDQPEFNSVDASLWYVVVVGELLQAYATRGARLSGTQRNIMLDAVQAILEGYAAGTRFGIQMDGDGLLAAGVPGVQLTWMDAKVGDWVVTPRIGKPVEVQALWVNALRTGGAQDGRWAEQAARAEAAFQARFWNPERGCLYDVVDVDHEPGRVDPTLRPNQIFAVGGLPHQLLGGDRADAVVDTVERQLLTPLGLRSLGPGEPGYRARYEGGPVERDGAYHQGTVWPWLLGPFVEAWLRRRRAGPRLRAQARARFLTPLLEHLEQAGLGHVSEIADAEPPFTPRGCPFQAWSVGEALRIDRMTAPDDAG